MTKEEKQVNFFKKAAINLTENNFILQHAISEFKKYLENEISLCSLAITACGVDAESAHVHRLYRERFKEKLKDCDIEKIILEGKELMSASTLPDEVEKEFKRCGQGENTCNCKSPDECGYNEIYE